MLLRMASTISSVSTRPYRKRVDAIEPEAEAKLRELVAEVAKLEDPLQRLAYWRVLSDGIQGEMSAAAADCRDEGLSWSAIAVAYDRTQPSTYSKFGRG